MTLTLDEEIKIQKSELIFENCPAEKTFKTALEARPSDSFYNVPSPRTNSFQDLLDVTNPTHLYRVQKSH